MTIADLPAERQIPSRTTAGQAFVASVVTIGVVILTLAMWKLRVVLALLLFGFTIAAAMRPGV